MDAETRAIFEQWTPPAEDTPARRSRTCAVPEDRWRASTWRSRFGVTGTSRPARSARLASRSAIPRCCPRRTASPKTICARCRRRCCRRRWPSTRRTWSRSSRRSAAVLLDDRLRLRARLRPGRAPLAAAGGRERAVSRAGRSDRSGRAARSADPGRGVRAVPASHVPRQDALLDRRARHARARSSTR